MKDIIKYAILGGVGYWVIKNYFPNLLGGTPTIIPSTSSVAPVYTNDTKTQIFNAAKTSQGIGWGGLLNADQWNYFYNKVRGVGGPDPTLTFPGQDRSFMLNIDEYWAGVSKAGMGRYGMGRYLRTGYGRRNYYVA